MTRPGSRLLGPVLALAAPLGAAIAAVLGAASAQDAAAFEELYTRLHSARERGYVALEQAIGDAATDTLALIVAAHPDDRWFLPATYLRRRHHWRVATLLFTRGEGGQNSSGPETGDQLGAIRTLEAETSAAMLDVELYWLNRLDAGFCRTADEALRAWGRDRTIADCARVLRRVRPDVIVTTHHPEETHGHDLAVLRVLPQAIEWAADPKFETPGFAPIKPPRLFRGVGKNEIADETLRADEIDPVRGETYRRLAYRAFSMHRSAQPFQPMDELFDPALGLIAATYRGADQNLRNSLDQGLPSLFDYASDAEAKELRRQLEHALREERGRERRLARLALELRKRLGRWPAPPDGDLAVRIVRRREALDRIIQHASALSFEVEVRAPTIAGTAGGAATGAAPAPAAVPGEDLPLRIRLQNAGGLDFTNVVVAAEGEGTLTFAQPPNATRSLGAREALTLDATFRLPEAAPGRTGLLQPSFQQLQFTPPVRLVVRLAAEGETLQYPFSVPTDVRPPIELQVAPRALLFSRDGTEDRLAVRVRRHTKGPIDGSLMVQAPAGFVVVGSPQPIAMAQEQAHTYEFMLKAPAALKPGVYSIQVQLGANRLAVPAHKVDVTVSPRLTVGLVQGVDDTAEAVLRGLNVNLVLLGDEDLAVRTLDDLQTIVCDIRSLRREAARAAFPRLLRFVEAGGRLVVCYHKDAEFNVGSAGFQGAPFPLHLSHVARVARPDAKVEVLEAQHPLLQSPNRILAEDWDGWVQERALYLPDEYSTDYVPLLQMRDEATLTDEKGALLYTRFGKGDYVYCALALHRQLKMLHPGACRLFANLISPERQ